MFRKIFPYRAKNSVIQEKIRFTHPTPRTPFIRPTPISTPRKSLNNPLPFFSLASLAKPTQWIRHFSTTPPNDLHLIELLFQYIRRNRELPRAIAAIQASDKKLQILVDAIKTGDAENAIFCDSDCALYLLYLIKQQKIPFWQGMTTYLYLMSLMQFSDKQSLKSIDQDVKFDRPVTVKKIHEANGLTDEGNYFLQTVFKRFKELNLNLDYIELVNFAKTLPPSEQWLIKIPYVYSDQNDTDKLIHILLSNVPFYISNHADKRKMTAFYMPSLSLINYLLKKVSPHPVNLIPIFGSIGKTTLQQLHEKNEHPLPLYAELVESNLKDADHYRGGPVPLAMHDAGHDFWGSWLDSQDRQDIIKYFIPTLRLVQNEAFQANDCEAAARIKVIIDKIYDFDLTDIHQFLVAEKRSGLYLARCFSSNARSTSYLFADGQFRHDVLGECVEDRLYFLLTKKYYELKQAQSPALAIWEKCWKEMRAQTTEILRPKKIIAALENLAKKAAGMLDFKFSLFEAEAEPILEPAAILNVLEKNSDSKMIWKILSEKHSDDLITLINSYGLTLFKEYLPLLPAQRELLKLTLEKQIAPPSSLGKNCN